MLLLRGNLTRCTHERRKRCVTPLSLAALLFGTAWLALLGTICVTTGELKPRGTYISENALMPGSALTDVNGVDLEQKGFPKDGFLDLAFPPLKGALFGSQSASDRREAVALVAKEGRGDDVLFALGHAMHRAPWLSKDVIFVILPQNETLPRSLLLRYWLDAYTNGAQLDLPRGGPIRGAIVIDVPPNVGKRGEPPLIREAILVQGMNGRLPNMDLINLARITGPNFAVHGKGQSLFEDENDETSDRSLHGVRFARDLLLGPTGWHGEFLHYGIESLSLKASAAEGGQSTGTTRLKFAQRIEKIVRSLSNIGEKFNRSFFFYVMLGLNNFVSIDEFLWTLIVLIIPLYFDAFFVALAPNENGFKQTRRALASLGLAVLIGFSVLIAISKVPFSPMILWGTSLVLFALWERFAGQRRDRRQMITLVEGAEPPLPSWRYKKAATEVYVFISLTALGVVHFPLALFAAALCYPGARLAYARPPGGKVIEWMGYALIHVFVFGGLAFLNAYEDIIPLRVPYESVEMLTAVLYLVVLPANMVTLSVLWSVPQTCVVTSESKKKEE